MTTNPSDILPRAEKKHLDLEQRSSEVIYNPETHSLELNTSTSSSLEKRQTDLRLFWDNNQRIRVLFHGVMANRALSDAFRESSVNIAQNLASALQSYLQALGYSVETWAHFTNLDIRSAGTFGVSVRQLIPAMFAPPAANVVQAVQNFFQQNNNLQILAQQCANAFDLSGFGYFNPPGQGPTSRKRNAGLQERQAVGMDYCKAPIGSIWNIVQGAAVGTFQYTLQC